MSKISRNAPCPCGSGEKYKKCCLLKQAETPQFEKSHHDSRQETAEALRAKILQFLERTGYAKHLKQAVQEFWQDSPPALDPEADDLEFLQFMEWYIHDYPIPGRGRPVIQLFLESKPKLPPGERQILEDWQTTHLSVFQVIEIEPGKGFWTEDIFSDEKIFFSHSDLSEQVLKWELLLLRKLKVLEEWRVFAVTGPESPQQKEKIREFVEDRFRGYKQRHPDTDLPAFLRHQGQVLNQLFLKLRDEPLAELGIFSSSGEELFFCEAHYDLHDFTATVNRLDREEDFEKTEEDTSEGQARVCFDWLERGRSSGRISDKLPPEGLTSLPSFFVPEPGHGPHRVLGTIILEPDFLALLVQGEEHLAVGREILEEVLAGLISHREDFAQALEDLLQDASDELMDDLDALEEEIPPEEKQAILKEIFDNHYRQWLDRPLSALKGQTPRQAAQNPEGRRLVEDLLRVMEFSHEIGELEYDVSWIRQELKL